MNSEGIYSRTKLDATGTKFLARIDRDPALGLFNQKTSTLGLQKNATIDKDVDYTGASLYKLQCVFQTTSKFLFMVYAQVIFLTFIHILFRSTQAKQFGAYLRQLSYAERPGPGLSHQTDKRGRGHTSEWRRLV